jgi:hypothetical protein
MDQENFMKQGPVAERDAHPIKIENVLAQSGSGEPLQLQPIARLGLVCDERCGRVQSELRLRGTRRRPAA